MNGFIILKSKVEDKEINTREEKTCYRSIREWKPTLKELSTLLSSIAGV